MSQELMTVESVAYFLSKSRSFIHKAWPKWVAYGVHPIRVGGTNKLETMYNGHFSE